MIKNLLKMIPKSRFSKDVYIIAFGQALSLLLLIAINKLISIYFSTDLYTVFSLASRSSVLFGYLMLFCLGVALPRYLPRFNKNKLNEINFFYASLIVLLISTTIIAALLVINSKLVSNFIFGNIYSSKYITSICLYSAGIATSTYAISYFSGKKMFKQYAYLSVIVQLISLVAVLIFKNNLAGQLEARGFLTMLFSFSVIFLIMKINYSKVSTNGIAINSNIKRILIYCIPRLPGELVLFSYSLVPLIIITNRFGLEASAGLAIAITSTSFVLPVFQLIGVAMLPHSSANASVGNYSVISRQIKVLSLIYLFIGLISSIAVWILAPIFIAFFFSSKFVNYADIVRIVYLSVVPMSFYMLLRSPIDALTKKALNSINLTISFVFLVISSFFMPSLLMCAAAFPLSYLLLTMLTSGSWLSILKKLKD